MAIGYPIHAEIQKTLNKRKGVLKRTKNPYASTGGKNPRKEIQKNIVKTPYISMLSSPKLLDSAGRPDQFDFTTADGKLDNLDIILSNQEYSGQGDEVNFSPINYGHELYTDIQKQGNKYKFEKDKNYSSAFKPKPGVVSLTSEYQSTSNVYFTRTVSVSWRCFHLDDLERLSRRFLTSNRLVYVEWGWSYPDEEKTSFITPEGLKIISKPKSLREEVINQGKGNFDAVLGYIQNFEWSKSSGGGFECKTDIISQGSDIFGQRVKDQTYFVNKEGARKKQETIVSGQKEAFVTLTQDEQKLSAVERSRLLTKKGLVPGSFNVYQHKVSPGFNKTFSYRGVENTLAEKGIVILEETKDGLEIETNAGSELQNSFKFTMDNLHLIVNDNMGSYGKQNIYEKTLFSKETEIQQQFTDTKEKNQVRWNAINEKAREEYDNNNWADWPGGVPPWGQGWAGDLFTREDAQRRRATRRETDRRFKEEFGLSKSDLKSGEKVKRNQQLAEQPNPNTTEELDVRFNSNLVQQTRTKTTLKDNITTLPDEYKNKTTLSEEILPDRTWVRWGWFEDNILNRFFGLCSADGTPIVQIRSLRKNPNFEELSDENKKKLEEALKSGGELAKDTAEMLIARNRLKEFEQERIFSNPGFLTPDINKFIFPGKFDLGEERGKDFVESDRNKNRRKVLENQGYKKFTKQVTKGGPNFGTVETLEFNKAQIFRKIDPETKKIIDQQILLTGQITNNDIRTILKTNDVNSIGKTLFGVGVGNPELNLDKINADEIKQELQSLLFLRELETIFQTNVSEFGTNYPSPFDAPGEEYEGRLRNIFINVKHLQEIFSQEATLGTCINSLLESLNYSAPIFNLVPVILSAENEGHIVFQDMRFIPSKNVPPERVYSFPVKITESFVKSMSVQSDTSSEANQILLSQKYSTMNLNNTFKDKKTGADVNSHRSFYSDENGLGSDNPGENQLVKEGERPFQKSETYGEQQGDFQKELSLTGGINLTLSDKNQQYVILPDDTSAEEKTTEGNLKYSQEIIGNYTMNGVLKSKLQRENVNEFESEQFEVSPYEEFGLIFVTNTMSLDGVAGIVPGMLYTTPYLPDKFLEKAYFFIQNTSQTVDSSTWTTEITGRVLHKFKETSGGLTNEQVQTTFGSVTEDSEEIEVDIAPNAFGSGGETQG